MHLKQFSVKGFKNCRQQIVLEEMGAICVIHGENNIGKSNVLEAIQLFFQLLTVPYRSQVQVLSLDMLSSEIEQLGFIPADIFNLELPEPIILHAILSIEEHELKEAGLEKLLPTSEVQIRLQLKQVLGKFKYQMTQFQFADGTDVTQQQASAEHYAAQLAVFMAQSASLFQTANTSNRFVLIGIDRHISSTEREATRSVVPQTLCLQLYDAKESREASYRKRWKLFVHTLQKFNDVLGDGEFTALFDRKAGRADLGFESLSSVFTAIEMGADTPVSRKLKSYCKSIGY
jgi:hypothetical protein